MRVHILGASGSGTSTLAAALAAALASGGALHDNHRAILEWAAAYDEGDASMRSRLLHETWLATLPCPVLRLEGEQPVGAQLERVARELATP